LPKPVLSVGEKEGNHLPLLFWALHIAGNRRTKRTLPKYGVASHTQCLVNAAKNNVIRKRSIFTSKEILCFVENKIILSISDIIQMATSRKKLIQSTILYFSPNSPNKKKAKTNIP